MAWVCALFASRCSESISAATLSPDATLAAIARRTSSALSTPAGTGAKPIC
ncbi:hypothetical protein VSR83_36265 [Paraburkholderia unamae]|uniref:Uncharacterized protein n=1 Tax=Paraburkholderia unamae TaxID=219649 RepID=A0ACC6RVF8_9BURK